MNDLFNFNEIVEFGFTNEDMKIIADSLLSCFISSDNFDYDKKNMLTGFISMVYDSIFISLKK